MNRYEKFDDWSEAFDTCRERNKPLLVTVWDEGSDAYIDAKIFPSGAVKEIRARTAEVNC